MANTANDEDPSTLERRRRDAEKTMEDYKRSVADLDPLTPEQIASGDSTKLERALFDESEPREPVKP